MSQPDELSAAATRFLEQTVTINRLLALAASLAVSRELDELPCDRNLSDYEQALTDLIAAASSAADQDELDSVWESRLDQPQATPIHPEPHDAGTQEQ